ncbi:hypothetical protein TNCV_1317511 [Trichonephila clavipes]|nr:hypothetical protein TNCV_1317511 [Trichonephila clavipes]
MEPHPVETPCGAEQMRDIGYAKCVYRVLGSFSVIPHLVWAVDEVNNRQLSVSITIQVHRTLSMSELRKPNMMPFRAHV